MARAVTTRRKAPVTVLARTIGLALFFPILWTVILSFKTEGDAIASARRKPCRGLLRLEGRRHQRDGRQL
ncbi:hypothetical protein SAMN04244550_01592 [Rhodobacter capsulatus]|uniref:Carbohydrate ABC transporter permease n=1 Tax=Rhodobacter capsulatus TaxID=1061 RepID=A0A1G7HX94_RHOCA|nr:hypothetical protein SAMN04244550_01592 [Rhodobacter capsulatus]